MIKRLSGCIREFKRDTVLTPVFMVGEVAMEVLIPFVMALLIDQGIDGGSMDAIVKYGMILLACALLGLAFGVAGAKTSALASAGFAKNLRQDIYYKIQDFSFANIDRFSTGGLVTRMTTDVTNVQMAFMMIIRVAVRSPMMLIFALGMSFYINKEISLIFLGAIPLLAIGLFIIIRVTYPVFGKVFAAYDKLNNVTQENIHGIRVVKSYVREAFEVKKFGRVSEDIYRKFSFAEKVMSVNMPLMMTAVYGSMLLASWIGAHLIVGGTLSTGELVSVINYAFQILMSLMMLSMILVMLTISGASAKRIFEVLTEKPSLTSPEEALSEVADGSVEFDHVYFSYSDDPEKCCLFDIDLKIKSGQTVGILGGTGSSKSSLVQLIPRLYDATSGEVKVGGRCVKEYDLESLRDAVSVVLQKNVLFSGTIKENMRWGKADATDEEIQEACRLAQADEFIQTFPNGYETHIEQGGSNVSGGQRQRLCIARALLKDPKILILDDSTSAVDMHTDAMIRRAFREEIPHVTKLIIAQRVSSVQDADQIIVLDDGKINGTGTHEELLAGNAIYQEVYHSQVKGGEENE